MNNTHHINITDDETIKRFLFGLIMECPMGGNPQGCLFHEMRCVKTAEKSKWEWINQLAHDELVNYYLAHYACISSYEVKSHGGSSD